MKNKFFLLGLLFISIFTFTGCGGGGGSSSTSSSSQNYDFYEYLVSSNTVTKNWDSYILDSSNNIYSTSLNIGSSTETILSTTKAIVNEDYSTTYEALSNSIYVIELGESGYLNRYISLGDYLVTDYRFTEYLDTFIPISGYIFNDVIKIQVDMNDGTYTYDYYSKNLGKIATTSNYNLGRLTYTQLSIVNNY